MSQVTVRELLKLCQNQVMIGNGDKHIVISDDNEGNGYHGMFYGFTPCTEEFVNDIYDSQYQNEEDTIILG
jgi:hypothetical protein